eukprot:6182839-Pleurochrysis_carterae.AAC.1
MTINDMGLVDLPPAFEYAAGEREALKIFALSHVAWMGAKNRYHLSPNFHKMLKEHRAQLRAAAQGAASSSTSQA